MKKSTQIDYAFTDRYVDLIREGVRPEEARKQANKEIYGVDIPEPKIKRSQLKSTDLADLQAWEQDNK